MSEATEDEFRIAPLPKIPSRISEIALRAWPDQRLLYYVLAMLVERATDSVVRVELDGDWEPEGPPLSNAEMMNLLKLHRAAVRGGRPQNYGWASKPPDMDEVRKGILRKIEAIARHDEREAARKARREARAAEKMAGEGGA
jgi:hypothetical protein